MGHSDHRYNPETGQVECECCCKWELDAERDRKRIVSLEAQVAALSKPVSEAKQQCDAECFRELLKRLRGYSVIMDIDWSEDWDEVLKRIVQRVQANNHLGKLAAERYDRILELERIIAARLKEPKECGYCGGTGEICYSSTSYGPCPECIAARLKTEELK